MVLAVLAGFIVLIDQRPNCVQEGTNCCKERPLTMAVKCRSYVGLSEFIEEEEKHCHTGTDGAANRSTYAWVHESFLAPSTHPSQHCYN